MGEYDSGPPGWQASELVTYAVSGESRFIDSEENFSIQRQDQSILLNLHSNPDDYMLLDSGTGAIERIGFHIPGYTVKESSAWRFHDYKFVPFGNAPGQPDFGIQLQPLSLGILAAGLLTQGPDWSGFPTTINANETHWTLSGTGSCLHDCIWDEDSQVALTEIHFSLTGELGEVWPSNVQYRYASTNGESEMSVELEQINTGGTPIPIEPGLEDSVPWEPLGGFGRCGLTLCGGGPDVPARFNHDQMMQNLLSSPSFIQWNSTNNAEFVSSALIGRDGSLEGPDDVDFYTHVVAVVGENGAHASFNIRTLKADASQSAAAVDSPQEHPNYDMSKQPINPYEGRLFSFEQIIAQAIADGINLEDVERIEYIATNSRTNPSENARIIIIFHEIQPDGTRADSQYGLGLGQRFSLIYR